MGTRVAKRISVSLELLPFANREMVLSTFIRHGCPEEIAVDLMRRLFNSELGICTAMVFESRTNPYVQSDLEKHGVKMRLIE